MKMELRQLKYFIEVAKREHVTEAADALHVAQSAVSRQIFKLEEELGVHLFIREGRNVKLTQVGHVFLKHIERAMHAFDYAEQVVKEQMDPERGVVHVGFTSSLASLILPTVISAFRKKYPHVTFRLYQASHYELEKRIIQGEMNIALLGPVPTKNERIKGTILFHEKIIALVPYTHRLAQEESITLDQLRNDPFVLFPKGYILRDMVTNACKQLGFQPEVSFEGQDIGTIKGLVSAGLGVTLIPEITLVNQMPKSFSKVDIRKPHVQRTVGMITPTERGLLPAEELFYEFAKKFFGRLERFQHQNLSI